MSNIERLAAKMEAKYGLVSQGATASALTGKYLADVVRYILGRIPEKSRGNAIQNLKHKLSLLDVNELSRKKMPVYSSIGQSITLLKTIFHGQNASWISEVLNA